MRSIILFLIVLSSVMLRPALVYAAGCDAIVGKWAWFVGGEVTINADGTFTQKSGNSGTWQCTDASKNTVTLKWSKGGFVNKMALSKDQQALSSVDPSQAFVKATRSRDGAVSSEAGRSASDLRLSTQPDGMRQLPKDLPELTQSATRSAHEWRRDAIAVSIRFTHLDVPNPALRGPEVRLSFISPSDRTGLLVTVAANGTHTVVVNQTVNWGELPLPPVFVDLPAAVRIAREHGMRGVINRADLRIWNPPGAPPVLAWMVGDKTINGASGEVIDYDVTGYITSYNAQWERAARSLRALLRHGRGGASSGGDLPFPNSGSSSDVPYDDGSKARAEYEQRAAESRAYWGGSAEDYNRVKSGECTWSDSSRFGC